MARSTHRANEVITMMKFRSVGRIGLLTAVVLLVLSTGAAVMPSAQSRDTDSVQALRELVAEVRGLRTVIERYAEAQLQTQTASELISVQQRRVADASGRLDAARRELEGTLDRLRDFTQQLAGTEVRRRQTTDPLQRAELEEVDRRLAAEIELMTERERDLRGRESELLNLLATEEGKWNELVARLDQWLRR